MNSLTPELELRLLAFVDGRLEDEDAARVQALMASDEAVFEYVARLREGLSNVDEAFALLATAPASATGADEPVAHEERAGARGSSPARHSRATPGARTRTDGARSRRPRPAHRSGRRDFAKVAMALVAAGAGYGVARVTDWMEVRPKYDQWLEAIAMQQRLYRRETLLADPLVSADAEELRARIRTETGVDVNVPSMSDAALELRRLQFLTWGNIPVIELAYLPSTGEPLSYCIMPTPARDIPFTTERIHGMNLVHWRRNGIAYAVVGEHSLERLREVSRHIYETSRNRATDA